MKPNHIFSIRETPLYLCFLFLMLTSCLQNFRQSDTYKVIKTTQKMKQIENSFSNRKALLYYHKADSALIMDNIPEAESYYQKAIQLENDNAFLNAKYGLFKLHLNQIESALKHTGKAIQLNPEESEFWSTRAIVYLSILKFTKALKDLEKARKINPTNATMFFVMAHIEKLQGNHSEACFYADSASMFVDDFQLTEQINLFRRKNCRINYYFNKISPYMVDPLGANLYFYSTEKDVSIPLTSPQDVIVTKKENISVKRDKIMIGVKNFIKSNYQAFKREEVDFLYYKNKGLRHLIISLNDNTDLSLTEIEALFANMKFPQKVIVVVMKGIDDGSNIR